MAKVYVNSSRSASDGTVPSEFLENLSYRKAGKRWYRVLGDNQHTREYFVAETQAAKVVGLAGGVPERENDPTYRAELYLIYLLARYQRQG